MPADYTITPPSPSSGSVGVASQNFSLAATGLFISTINFTPHDGSDGFFTPTTVSITNGIGSPTFTYTPGSSGVKSISVTNDGGLTDPSAVTYTASYASITATSYWSLGYQQGSGFTQLQDLIDYDPVYGMNTSGASGSTSSLTIKIDFGSVQSPVLLYSSISYAGVLTHVWESSNDASSWSAIAGSYAFTPDDHLGIPGYIGITFTPGSPVVARYLRYSAKDTSSGTNIPQIVVGSAYGSLASPGSFNPCAGGTITAHHITVPVSVGGTPSQTFPPDDTDTAFTFTFTIPTLSTCNSLPISSQNLPTGLEFDVEVTPADWLDPNMLSPGSQYHIDDSSDRNPWMNGNSGEPWTGNVVSGSKSATSYKSHWRFKATDTLYFVQGNTIVVTGYFHGFRLFHGTSFTATITNAFFSFWINCCDPLPPPPSYCPQTSGLTVEGTWHRTDFIDNTPSVGTHHDGEPYENAIISVFYKMCKTPKTILGRKNTLNGATTYCSDGDLFVEQVTTDCNGYFTWTKTGSITGVGLTRGPYVTNPKFNCQECDKSDSRGNSNCSYFIQDPSHPEYFCCSVGGGIVKENGSTYVAGDGVTDTSGSTPCGFSLFQALPCYTFRDTYWEKQGSGNPISGLTGTYTIDLDETRQRPTVQLVGLKDGVFYLWGGTPTVTLTNTCGDSLSLEAGPSTFYYINHDMDWWNINGVSFGAVNCADITGTVVNVSSYRMLYPANKTHIPENLCRCDTPTFYIIVKDCSGATPNKISACTFRESVMLGWITSGNSLKVAVHHGIPLNIGSPASGWETTQTIEATNADNIGLAYLQNSTAYLDYTLSGVDKYRTSLSRGTSLWSGTGTPSPSTSGHSGGTISTNMTSRSQVVTGTCTFSQCMDNTGVTWSSGVTVDTGCDSHSQTVSLKNDTFGVLYSKSSGGAVYWKNSSNPSDWSVSSVSTGMTGQVAGVCQLSTGVLIGLLWDSGTSRTTACHSFDLGLTWTKNTYHEESIPVLALMPALVSIHELAVAVFVTGDVPQFVVCKDGIGTDFL